MLGEKEALAEILQSTPAAVAEELALELCGGRFATREHRATVPLPGFDQSAMDGYAVRSADLGSKGGSLRLVGALAAGSSAECPIAAGQAVRIFTGAPLPAGADSVLMQEDVEVVDDQIYTAESVEPGEFVRRAGEVLCRGQRIVSAGDLLTPGRIGLLASQGLATAEVGCLPRVAVVTSGDELIEAGEALREGQLFNSNGPMLEAAVRRIGIREIRRWHAPDTLEATESVLAEALDWAEVVLTAGGVSVGDRDFIRPALENCGVETRFWRLRLRPGKPLLYGVAAGGQQVFGLPGNPVSASVTFAVLALPALHARMGAGEGHRGMRAIRAKLASNLANDGDRPHFVRGVLDDRGLFWPRAKQGSHDLRALSDSDALVRVGVGEALAEGGEVSVLILP